MATAENFQTLDLSRRRLLRGMALAGIGGALTAGMAAGPAGAAKSKMAQSGVAYQPTPKGKQRCDGCVQWQAPSTCKVVAGAIAPAGWCTLYAGR